MLDFFQWFPMSEGGEWAVRFAAFGGLVSMAWSTCRERREYSEKLAINQRIKEEEFATRVEGIASAAMEDSFRTSGMLKSFEFVKWYGYYMRCATTCGNFFVFSG